jgi:basic amino acid/polyamine antiporter, APA family
MSSSESEPQAGKARLGLFDAVSIIVGIIIGSTIYETAPLIFGLATNPWIALGLWAGAGLLAFVGALCYAELATTYPRDGGDYNYLTRAYGPLPGYLFGWAQLAVVQTGSIGMMAYIFASYMVAYTEITQYWSLAPVELGALTVSPQVVYASAAVVVLTLINALGVVLGKLAQNLLTFVKVVGLLAIVVAGFAFSKAGEREVFQGTVVSAGQGRLVIRGAEAPQTFKVAPKVEKGAPKLEPEKTTVAVLVAKEAPETALNIREVSAPSYGALSVAMILILLAYGGYNDAGFVAAEVRNRKRNLPLTLFIGTLLVMLIYLLVNGAYLWGLGFEGAAGSQAIATDTLRLLPGEAGARGAELISILVMVSALAAVNGLIFTSSRIYATMGADYSLFAPLGRRTRGGTPLWSLLLQMLICLAMIWSVGTEMGRDALNEVFEFVGVPRVAASDWGRGSSGGFETLLKISAPIFWLFFLMTGLAMFVLRLNDPGAERPFRTPLFPLVPLLFCAMCAFGLHSGINYARQFGLVGGGLVLLGIPFYVFSRRSNVAAGQVPSPPPPPAPDDKWV